MGRDSCGVRLFDVAGGKHWRLTVEHYLSKPPDLRPGMDATEGTDIEVRLRKFPAGFPQGVQSIIIQGGDLRDFSYSEVRDEISLKFRPVKPSLTGSLVGLGYTAIAGIDFYYSVESFTTLGGAATTHDTGLSGPTYIDPAGAADAQRFCRVLKE